MQNPLQKISTFFYAVFVIFFILNDIHGKSPSKAQNLTQTLGQVAQEYREAEATLDTLEKELKTLEQTKQEKTALLKQQYQKAHTLLVTLYQLKKNMPSYVLTQKNPEVTVQSAILLKQYIHALQSQVQKIGADLKQIEETTHQTTEKKVTLEKQLDVYKEKKEQLEKLIQRQKQKQAQEIKKNQALLKKAQKLANQSSNFKELISKVKPVPLSPPLSAEISADSKAPLYKVKPVQGKILAPFTEKHPMSPEGKGVVFETRPGEFVFAPLSGQIVYAGPFRLYKQIVIIAHHTHYHTVLTGLDRLDVITGEWVRAGEPLGIVEGHDQKNFLYLELRHQGIPINPHQWMAWNIPH